ncbi:hypothetical protein HBE96_13220 [Clostridium sp. P21]|uniref:Uncharacterized protein n=1 Tax=Clostridium muellerianum TaxID=2716538 RepID=A0A7Y0HQB9_9CLOT|nr:hypothetical protein [Clostridium muellerianum]NMM63618.1 hypothetical protein [Clostridium muellerianum]
MINANEAKEILIRMLNEAGFNFDSPNPKLAWKTFKEFFNTKVDCADDALLFQCGGYDFTGENLFYLEFVRQFVFETDGEYDHMEQLRFTLYFKTVTELKELETNLWSYDCDSVDEFFSKVENMNYFKMLIENYVSVKCEVKQGEI